MPRKHLGFPWVMETQIRRDRRWSNQDGTERWAALRPPTSWRRQGIPLLGLKCAWKRSVKVNYHLLYWLKWNCDALRQYWDTVAFQWAGRPSEPWKQHVGRYQTIRSPERRTVTIKQLHQLSCAVLHHLCWTKPFISLRARLSQKNTNRKLLIINLGCDQDLE